MEIPRTILDSEYGLLFDLTLEIFLAKIVVKSKKSEVSGQLNTNLQLKKLMCSGFWNP